MIRLRMNGLMSRASTLVLAAAFGSAGTAVAGTTITGPGPFGHVHITNNTDFVVIEAGATIGVDPLPGGVNSFANDPGIVINSLTTGEIDVTYLRGIDGKLPSEPKADGGEAEGASKERLRCATWSGPAFRGAS